MVTLFIVWFTGFCFNQCFDTVHIHMYNAGQHFFFFHPLKIKNILELKQKTG